MSRPAWDKAKVETILQQQFDAAKRKMPRVVLLGVRGYFQDSMGIKGQNDRGIYDDAMFIYSPLYFRSFNFNTDPSRHGMNEEGKVLLKVRVSAQGTALDVAVSKSSGFSRLDAAAADAVTHWRFVPAKRGDEAVDSSVIVPITFALE